MADQSAGESIELVERSADRKVAQPRKPDINVDSLLREEVGANGLWQWSIIVLLMASTPFTPAFPVFVNSTPEKRCRMEPEWEYLMLEQNLSFHEIGRVIGPWYLGEREKSKVGCVRYTTNWTNYTLFDRMKGEIINNVTEEESLGTPETEPCPYGYVFSVDGMQYPGSVIAEFSTVCDNEWLAPFGTSIFMFGMMCGSLISGWVGDCFGRKPTALFMTGLEIVSAIGISLSPNYTSYTVFRSLSGAANMGRITVYNVLTMELTLACYRSYFIAALSLGFDFLMRGFMSLIAFYIPDWRLFNVAVSVPSVIGVLQLSLLSESPRWLCARSRLPEAISVLNCGYRVNHLCRKNPEQKPVELMRLEKAVIEWTQYKAECVTTGETSKRQANWKACLRRMTSALFQPFSTLHLARISILGIIVFAAQSMIFYGLMLYVNAIRGSVYLVSFVNSAMAVPGIALSMIVYRFVRQRRLPLVLVFLVSFVALLIGGVYTYVVQPETDIWLNVTSNIGIVCTVSSMFMLYIYLPELYPSKMRSQGFGLVSGLGNFGSMICTFVNQLDNQVRHGLPILIYTGVTLVVVGLLFALPDTSGENLADASISRAPEHSDFLSAIAKDASDEDDTEKRDA